MARNGSNRNNKGRNGNSNRNNGNNYDNNNRNNNNGNSNGNGHGHNGNNNNNNHSNGYSNGNGNGNGHSGDNHNHNHNNGYSNGNANNDNNNHPKYNKRSQYQDFGTGPSPFGVNPPCQYCRKTNHLSLNCHFAPGGKNSQNNNQNQNGNGNSNGNGNGNDYGNGNGHGNGKQGKTPNKPCKHCNLTGHWSSGCPNIPQNQGQNNHNNQNQAPNRLCKYCQGPHLNKDCPTRNGNNQNGYQNGAQNPPLPQDYICRFCNQQAGHWDQDCPNYLAAAPIIPPQIQTVHFSRPCRHCNGMHADGDCASHSHPQGQGQTQGQPRSHAYAEENSPSPVHPYGSQDSTQIDLSYDFAVDDSGDAIMTEAPPLRGPPVYIGNGLWEQDGHIWRQDPPPGCNW